VDLKCPRLNSQIPKAVLEQGIKVEYEHTNSRRVASCIARAHLNECPDYYTRLKRMEKSCKR
jgi:hypothetical protein